ncbi:leucine--tRNA ligase [Candidatus Gracilibacteria bacterium]|nr:leucine--tRNA ligase [Candidatus Gracilibacteria bacterium]
MAQKYDAVATEQKWQKKWEESGVHTTDLTSKKPKWYNLVMFPYPSGDKLHVGHWYNYGPADSFARYKRMNGFNVLEPMGYDSFGLPAENYAIKTGTAPRISTEKNIEYMTKQLTVIGTMYDWDKAVITSRPDYYKWTQWCFLELYKKGLAYKKEAPVNWCPKDQTVLANEQVKEGMCDRCGSEVMQKNLTQWFFKITDYCEDLLKHEGLDWPEKTKIMQTNWIGKKTGINIDYQVKGLDEKITVFTTRPDTNFGATFLVVAPDGVFVKTHMEKFPNKKDVEEYVEKSLRKTELERMAEGKKKTGAFTGLYAINNLNGREMPIYVGDFVLGNFGTGNVVAVPAHDLRDFDFAQAMNLDIIRVVVGKDGDASEITKADQVQEEEGTMINSDFLNGLDIHVATQKIMDYLEEKGWGKRIVSYRLRDWLLSRQRYWGAPIPIINCVKCGEVPVPEKDLPVVLPEQGVDYLPKGKAPLASVDYFMNTQCPTCGGPATREPDTMDTFVDSSWYFLRYLSPKKDDAAFDPELIKKWLPVDLYIGGPEHACMHLLYARFIHKVLVNDRKSEPFKKLVHQGLITKDGAKMSKSKGNVVSPDEFVAKYGSDVFRIYLMFMGPFTDGGDWNDRGITGIARFAQRVWDIMSSEDLKEDNKESLRAIHNAIKKVSEDIETFHFNTALSCFMELVNLVLHTGLTHDSKMKFAQIIAPLAPHLAEEAWELLGQKESIFTSTWPTYDKSMLVAESFELVIQVNGKVRGRVTASMGITEKEAMELAHQNEATKPHIDGKKIVKVIYVPNKLLNIVAV